MTTPTKSSEPSLQIRDDLARTYTDIYTAEAMAALTFMARFNDDQKRLMAERIGRRARRIQERQPIGFLDPAATIPGTTIGVADARAGKFVGSLIPGDLQRQWIQGTGPAAKPNAPIASSLRNVAYALLSGADGSGAALKSNVRFLREKTATILQF